MTSTGEGKAARAAVAVVTRTKDRVVLLKRNVECVLAQTHADWMHVIVNDGGDAAEVEALLEPYKVRYAGRLIVIHNPVSLGMEAASNKGIVSSDSEYVVILDDDDTWHPEFLQACLRSLEDEKWPGTMGVISHTTLVFETIEGREVIETERRGFNQWMPAVDLLHMFQWNRFPPASFLFRRAALDEVGMFDESLPVCGDWEFHLRFLSKYEIAVVPRTLAFWHQRPNSNGSYGNSVIAGKASHAVYRARLINRWMRAGLKDGTMGFGTLFGAAIAGEGHYEAQRRSATDDGRPARKIARRVFYKVRSLAGLD